LSNQNLREWKRKNQKIHHPEDAPEEKDLTSTIKNHHLMNQYVLHPNITSNMFKNLLIKKSPIWLTKELKH